MNLNRLFNFQFLKSLRIATIDVVNGSMVVVACKFLLPWSSRLSEPEKSAVNSRICRVSTWTYENEGIGVTLKT